MKLSPGIAAAWTRTPISPVFWLTLVAYDLGFGLVLTLGAESRVSGASFATMREYGGHITWGAAFTAVGVIVAVGPLIGRRFLGIALTTAGVLHLLLAAGFIAAAQQPNAALTGALTYPLVAVLHVLHGWHYRRTARTS